VSRWPNKYVIGLTGNIAVGKSVVRQMLQHLGAYTIDADGLGHQALAPGAPSYAPVVDMFGKFILDSEGRIDRRKLGAIVFSMPDALETLERLTHPVVLQAINTLILRAKQRVVVVEAIKLLETDLANAVDVVWVVDASRETQLRRLVEKRGLSPEEALRRVTAQPAQRDKLKRAHYVITNDGNVRPAAAPANNPP
jgi:dephospho-CoA kinase